MDQASHVRETAASARRFVCRTLTVVGGVAAGTAIAWCLSTATASAESVADPAGDQNPVQVGVVSPLVDTLGDLTGTLADAPPVTQPIEQVGDQVVAVTDQLAPRGDSADLLPGCVADPCGDDAEEEIDTPAADAVEPDGLTGPHPATVPTVARAATTVIKSAKSAVTGAVTGSGVDPDRTAARTATDRAYAAGTPHRGSAEPSMPQLPTVPAPPVPSAPASGHTGANPADSPLFAALPWLDRPAGLVRGRTLPAVESTTAGRAGAQPGTAPD